MTALPVDAESLPALSLWQPWASLVATRPWSPDAGWADRPAKWIETRSWRAPSWLVGQRFAIAAAARIPTLGSVGEWTVVREHRPYHGHGFVMYRSTTAPGDLFHSEQTVALPLGAVLLTAVLDACVPMVEAGPATPEEAELTRGSGAVVLAADGGSAAYYRPGIESDEVSVDVSDQLPLGDFAPGRFGWVLGEVEVLDEPDPFSGGQRLTKRWTPR